MVNETDSDTQNVEISNGDRLMRYATGAAKLAFGEVKPTIKNKKGGNQGLIEVGSITNELMSVNWKTIRPNVYRGRPENPKGLERWEGMITKKGFFFTNIGVESPQGLERVVCLLPDHEKDTPGSLVIETKDGYLTYTASVSSNE